MSRGRFKVDATGRGPLIPSKDMAETEAGSRELSVGLQGMIQDRVDDCAVESSWTGLSCRKPEGFKYSELRHLPQPITEIPNLPQTITKIPNKDAQELGGA